MDLHEWLEAARWTSEHDAAFAGLDARSRLGASEGSFEDRWPADTVVDGWILAAFVDAALACVDGHPPRLRVPHARALVTQTRRSFGWGHSALRGPVRARAALATALVGEWDLVVTALGGRPLAQTVSPKKAPRSLEGLVRHVATAARQGLGEASCAQALATYVKSATVEPATFWALARLAIEVAGGHPRAEVPTRWRALAGGDVVTPARTARPAAGNPRVLVFERYMHLWNDADAIAALERDRPYIEASSIQSWESHIAGWVAQAWILGLDESIARVRPTLERLDPVARTSTPLPGAPFRAMLGLPAPDAEALRESLLRFHRASELSVLRRYRWSTAAAAVALAAGDTLLVRLLTPGAKTKKEKLRAGASFGDDPRRVLRYFASALDANAAREDVTPAFLSLLGGRVPDGHDRARTGGAWGWESLLCLAYVYFHRLGGARAEDVPRLLRATLRGEPT